MTEQQWGTSSTSKPEYVADQQAMRMALEAFEKIIHWYALRDRNDVLLNFVDQNPEIKKAMQAITALRQALEQKPADEPVAMNWSVFNTGAEVWDKLSLADAVVELTPARLERGWSAVCVINKDNPPLYTRPQPADWVSLTDEEIEDEWGKFMSGASDGYIPTFVKAIEAKLKEKNT